MLITLGIIGIVAALTIPTLIQNYQKKVTSTRLKQFYSLMTQAIELSKLENGDPLDWTKEDLVYKEDGTEDLDARMKVSKAFYEKYLNNYLKTSKIEAKDGIIGAYLNNGSKILIYNASECHFTDVDINADSAPNAYGKDRFCFLICPRSNNASYHPLKPNNAFGAYALPDRFDTRAKALDECKKQPAYCSVLLEIYDNWEFKEDYPW